MSRVGRAPVAVPAGVSVEVKEGLMTVKGPKGTLTQDIDPQISVAVEADTPPSRGRTTAKNSKPSTACTGRCCTIWSSA